MIVGNPHLTDLSKMPGTQLLSIDTYTHEWQGLLAEHEGSTAVRRRGGRGGGGVITMWTSWRREGGRRAGLHEEGGNLILLNLDHSWQAIYT